MLEYLKANRLGNKIALVNGRYESNEPLLPKLSEKINDKIIFQKQLHYLRTKSINVHCIFGGEMLYTS